MRFAVSNRIEADARLAQAEAGRAAPGGVRRTARARTRTAGALPRRARAAISTRSATTSARVVDLGFRTALPELGVELSSNLGIAAELDDGGRELRKILVGARRDAKLLDPVDVRIALVRTEEWAPVQLEIVAVDVIEQRRAATRPDLDADRAEAHAWIGDRVARVLELAADRPTAGRPRLPGLRVHLRLLEAPGLTRDGRRSDCSPTSSR